MSQALKIGPSALSMAAATRQIHDLVAEIAFLTLCPCPVKGFQYPCGGAKKHTQGPIQAKGAHQKPRKNVKGPIPDRQE